MSIVTINNVRLYEEDDMVCLHASRNNGTFEPETFEFLETEKIYKGRFVDIGAYSGIYGIRAEQLGLNSIFFEPNVKNYYRLLANIQLNDLIGGDRCKNIALSSKESQGKMFMNPIPNMTSAGSLEQSKKKIHTQDVTIMKYDSYFTGNESVIKIDVEGHELDVLIGMSKTLLQSNPILIIELLSDTKEEPVVDYLNKFGYEWQYRLDKRNVIFIR